MGENKIKIGLFAFMTVGPGHHKEFNRWHSYEHMPEFLVSRGEPVAMRYVATPDLVAVRPEADPVFAPSQYLVCYYLQGPAEESLKEHVARNDWLVESGHVFKGVSDARHMGAYDFVKAYVNPRTHVTPEALLHRPHTGLHITLVEPADPAHSAEIADWYDRVHFNDMLTLKGFAGAWRFVSRGQPFAGFENPPERWMHLYFLDEDPAECLADMRETLPGWVSAGRGLDARPRKVVFAGAFRTIVDDRYDAYE